MLIYCFFLVYKPEHSVTVVIQANKSQINLWFSWLTVPSNTSHCKVMKIIGEGCGEIGWFRKDQPRWLKGWQISVLKTLKKLVLFSWKKRRLDGDLITVFKFQEDYHCFIHLYRVWTTKELFLNCPITSIFDLNYNFFFHLKSLHLYWGFLHLKE